MTQLLLAFLIMLGIVAAMAIGVMAGRKPIAGSCGGLAGLGTDAGCEICGGNPARCANEPTPARPGRATATNKAPSSAARPS